VTADEDTWRSSFPTTVTVKFLMEFFVEESGKQTTYCVHILVLLVSVIWHIFSQLWDIIKQNPWCNLTADLGRTGRQR